MALHCTYKLAIKPSSTHGCSRSVSTAAVRPSNQGDGTNALTRSASVAAAVLASVAITTSPAIAAEVVENFTNKCAGCHSGGGNVVAAGATLFTGDLQRNGVADPESLYKLIYAGKNKMPGFGKECAPKGKCTFGPRLEDEEITALSAYVMERAAADWK